MVVMQGVFFPGARVSVCTYMDTYEAHMGLPWPQPNVCVVTVCRLSINIGYMDA